ncbi:MAG: hypothetical protein ACI9L6_000533 [Flavobacterium sp.]|jgi:hypothetical protein
MNFSSIKNLKTIYLYLISVVCFVLANLIREINIVVYYILLVLGLGFFVLGLIKKANK